MTWLEGVFDGIGTWLAGIVALLFPPWPPAWWTWLTDAFKGISKVTGDIFKLVFPDWPPKWWTWLTDAFKGISKCIGDIFKLVFPAWPPKWLSGLADVFTNIKNGLKEITDIIFPAWPPKWWTDFIAFVQDVLEFWTGGGAAAASSYQPVLSSASYGSMAYATPRPSVTIQVNMGGAVIREEADVKKLAKAIAWEVNTQLAGGFA